MNTNAMAWRPGWWLVFWGLLTSLSLNWVLPALDHHAAEYSPFHSHAVVGAASAAEREQLLAHHTHGAGQPHQHPQPPNAAAEPIANSPLVLNLGEMDGVLTLVARAGEVVAPAAWVLPPQPLALWLMVGLLAVLVLRQPLPPPEHPPRLA